MDEIHVVAAVIERDGKILVCRRNSENDSGLWEFPGGKVEAGETPREAMVREIREELAADIEIDSVYAQTVFQTAGTSMRFTFFRCAFKTNDLRLRVHREAAWVTPSEMTALEFMPADIEVVEKLQNETDRQLLR